MLATHDGLRGEGSKLQRGKVRTFTFTNLKCFILEIGVSCRTSSTSQKFRLSEPSCGA